jgi:hypothetical protein
MPEASWLLFVVASLVLITTRGQGMIRIVCHWSVGKVVSQLRCKLATPLAQAGRPAL